MTIFSHPLIALFLVTGCVTALVGVVLCAIRLGARYDASLREPAE